MQQTHIHTHTHLLTNKHISFKTYSHKEMVQDSKESESVIPEFKKLRLD